MPAPTLQVAGVAAALLTASSALAAGRATPAAHQEAGRPALANPAPPSAPPADGFPAGIEATPAAAAPAPPGAPPADGLPAGIEAAPGTRAAPGEGGTEPATAQPPAHPPNPDEILGGKPPPPAGGPPEQRWFDQGHRLAERYFFAPVVRVDEFFGAASDLDPERAQSFIRLRNSLRVSDLTRPTYTVDVLANLRFPAVNNQLNRLRLVLAGAVNDTLADPSGTTDPTSLRSRDNGGRDAELRFGAFQGLRTQADLGVGIIAALPVGAFARARYRVTLPVGHAFLWRSAFSVFWRTDTLLGARVDSALERHLGESTLVRLHGSGQVSQQLSRGLEFRGDLSLLHAFTDTSAGAVGGELWGASRAPGTIDRYRLFTRGRQAVLRRWIFVELEPELSWPWVEGRGRVQEIAATFRLEFQFQGGEAVGAAAERRASTGD